MDSLLIKKLPKVDLHCHLDGSVRTATILELARMQNYKLPADTVDDLRRYVRVPLDCKSLGEFLNRFEVFYPLLTNSYALERIAYELCSYCASENVKYLEMRFAPVLQKTEQLPIPDVIESVLKGIRKGEKEFGIKAGVILCLYRGTDIEDSMMTAKCAVELKDKGVCGVDIAGDESRFPLKDFEKPIELCKNSGVNITIHAGEASGPESIKEAVDMGADRIGHGVTLQQDEILMKEIAEKRIPLEICLTSNIHTQVIEDYKLHPFKKFIENGVVVTLNTDDRGVSGIDLTYEYEKALEYGLKIAELKNIIMNSVDAAFLNDKEKNTLKMSVQEELKTIGE
jgi:adenosine deaminase